MAMTNAEKQQQWRERQKSKARIAALQAYYVGRCDAMAGRDYRDADSLTEAIEKLSQADEEANAQASPQIVIDTYRS